MYLVHAVSVHSGRVAVVLPKVVGGRVLPGLWPPSLTGVNNKFVK